VSTVKVFHFSNC